MFLGACNYKKIGLIGALPVGLKGKLYGQPFKVLVQYDAFGGVRTQIFEDEEGGGMITEIRGDRSEKKTKGKAFADWAYSRYAKQNANDFPFKSADSYSIKERDSIRKDMEKRGEAFIKNLVDETIDYNKGEGKTKKATEKVNIGPSKPAVKKAPTKKDVVKKYKTIYVGPYTVPGYTVPKHKRRILLK
jgi:hypothetical protein